MGMPWVSLFSGGKDSSWALYRALSSGREVSHLVTVHPTEGSYMYHVPGTHVAALAADSIGIPLVEVTPEDMGASEASDAADQGDKEVEPLEAALRDLASETEVDGLVAGAVESEFQTSRIKALAERLDADLYAPLWQGDPTDLATSMLEAGFEIRIIAVAADGLGPEWLGRTLDSDTLTELQALSESRGVHILGEGGEFETLVTDGPHMDQPICIEAESEWDGTRGQLNIQEAWLGGH
jgi:diphthine-ammonia ligase